MKFEHVQVGEVKLGQNVLEPQDKKLFSVYVDYHGKRFKQGAVVAMYRHKKTAEEIKAVELAQQNKIKEKRNKWSKIGSRLGLSAMEEEETIREYREKVSKARAKVMLENKRETQLERIERKKAREEEKREEQKKKTEERIKALERKAKELSNKL